MKVLALDDEKPALAVLEKAIKEALPDAETVSFSLPSDALAYITENPVDVVFCDCNMPEINGIDFGKRVKKIFPKTDIVFVTGYDDYAINAVNSVAPQGYILKPISKSKILSVLDNLHTNISSNGLYVKTFGTFDVTYDGVPVEFKVKKAKELFAFLIDKGGSCTRRELTAVLYEDRDENNAVRYLTDAVKCLTETLKKYNAEKAFSRHFNSYSVDSRYFSCDLFEYMNGNLNLFNGEYMSKYSWAEYKQTLFL